MRIRSNLNGLDEALEDNGAELQFVQLQLIVTVWFGVGFTPWIVGDEGRSATDT